MFPVGDGPLNTPSDMKVMLDKMGRRGKAWHHKNKDKPEPEPEPIMTSSTNWVLTLVTAILTATVSLVLLFFIFRHFKLHTLVSGLTLMTTPKMIEARTTDPSETVICSNPYLTILATVVTLTATLMWVCAHCRQLTWLRGYKYSRACTLYIFLYSSHFYVPLKVKRLTGHMHMYHLENPITPDSMSFHKKWLWDAFTINWKTMIIRINGEPVALPHGLTVPLRDKIKTRNIMKSEETDLQFMIKQGANWYNLTEKKVSPRLNA